MVLKHIENQTEHETEATACRLIIKDEMVVSLWGFSTLAYPYELQSGMVGHGSRDDVKRTSHLRLLHSPGPGDAPQTVPGVYGRF